MVRPGNASIGTDPGEIDRVFGLLDRVRREWFASRVLAGLFAFLGLLLGFALLLILGELLFAPPAPLRLAMFIAFLLVSAAGTVALLRRFFANPTDEEIALLVESHRPDLHNELINAVRFTEDPREMRHVFVRAALTESGRRAGEIDPRGIVSWGGVRRALAVAGGLILVWGCLLLIMPGRTANAALRLLRPYSNVARLGSVRIVNVIPGDTTVVLGDNLTIEAELEGISGTDIVPHLEHAGEDGPTQREPMLRAEPNRYTAELLALKGPRTYRVVAGGSRSRRYRIRVTERPLVTRVAAEYTFPDYTGRPAQTVADTGGAIRALKGTRAALTIFSNKRLRAAQLTLPGEEPLIFGLAPDGFSAFTRRPLLLRTPAEGSVEITDEFGCKNTRSLQIEPLRDQPPQVTIVSPGKDRTLGVGESLELVVRGSDDFGVARAELFARRVGAGRPEEAQLVRSWSDFSDPRAVAIQWTWTFPPDDYRSGDVIRYFVRMIDENDVDGPGVGTSAEFVVRLEDVDELRRQRETKLSNWQAELMRVLEKQKELRRETDLLLAPSSQPATGKERP